MSEFWIDDYEKDGADLVLFVSCFGPSTARRVAEGLGDIPQVKVVSTEFVEVVVQECDLDGGVTHDDHYVVTARVDDAVNNLDDEYDRVHDALERSLA